MAHREKSDADRTFLLCLLASTVEGYDFQALGVAGPKLMSAIRLTPLEFGWAISINTLGLLLGAVIGGRLADQFGRKPILVAAMLLYGAATFATAYADGLTFLIWCRVVTGIGLGAAMPNLIALTAEASAPERRAGRVTLMAAGMSLGAVAASAPPFLLPDFDWRTIFHIGGILPCAVAFILLAGLPKPAPAAAGEVQASNRGYAQLFRGGRLRVTVPLWAAFLFSMIVLWLLFNWLPTLLVAEGYSMRDAAIAILVFNIGGMIGAAILGRLSDSMRRDRLIGAAYGGVALGVLAMALVTDSRIAVILAALLIGLFLTGAQFLLYGLSSESYPVACRATGVGAAFAVGRLGSFLGPLLAGGLLGAGGSPALVLALLIPLIGLAGTCAWALARAQRVAAEPA